MRAIVVFVCVAVAAFCADATLEIIKNVGSNLNVLVEYKNKYPSDMEKKLKKAIEADLRTAGFYNIVAAPAAANPSLGMDNPVYANAGINHLIRLEYFRDGNQAGLRVQAYDVKNKRAIFSPSYTVSRDDRYIFLAHYFVKDLADKVGVGGLGWMSKYVILSKHTGAKRTEIMIADYTLTFRQTIVKGGFNVFPKWANSEQNAYYYTSYQKKPTLYRVDLYSGKREKIIESEGMLVCSDVSTDGKKLLLTMAPDDQPDIFELDLTTKKYRRLTRHRGIDVNGHYLDDGQSFVFVSDRFGYPEIFYARLNAPDNAVQFIFKGRNNNYVDTYRHYAAFVSRETDSEFSDNTFNLYLVSTRSDYIRQLTTTGKNGFPRFSSSGDTILYIKEMRRESALGVIRLSYNKSFLFPLSSGSIQAVDW
ncbi:MAG: Tol-Pal system protein TolB [Helicobacteraceae bacterium]|jgi:TolB protein|nr:Tol-Pal system protein TolB [Helicobacteraceae bacterium]